MKNGGPTVAYCSSGGFRAWQGPADDPWPPPGVALGAGHGSHVWIFPGLHVSSREVLGHEGQKEDRDTGLGCLSFPLLHVEPGRQDSAFLSESLLLSVPWPWGCWSSSLAPALSPFDGLLHWFCFLPKNSRAL